MRFVERHELSRLVFVLKVATADRAMCQDCSTVTVCDSNPVTISLHTFTNMYGSHSC